MNYREEYNNEEEFIDVRALIRNYLRIFYKSWFIMLILCAVLSAGLIRYKQITSVNTSYTASAIYTVEKGSDIFSNAAVAERLAKGVNALTNTRDFRAQINEILGRQESAYQFYSSSATSSNFITVLVYTYDEAVANELMEAFDQVYQNWVVKAIGNAEFERKSISYSHGMAAREWSPLKMLVLGVMGGCFIWFFFATIGLIFVRKINDEYDMRQITTVDCLGILPEVKKKRRDKSKKETLLMTEEHVDQGYRQSLRSLRQQMDLIMEKGQKVFMVTSTDPSEGKSLLTLNLAFAMAGRKKRVTVIDTDFYGQGVARLLQVEKTGSTLMDYMEDTSMEIAAPIKVEGVSVIFSGSTESKGVNYLNAKRLQEIIEKVKEESDIILLDTAPVNPVGDALVFSEVVDAVLYVVRCEYAQAREITKGMESFYRNQKLAGYILNRVNTPNGDKYGYYSYGYGYGYGYGGRYGRYYTSHRYGDEESMQEWEE